jgi:hypothetical protein
MRKLDKFLDKLALVILYAKRIMNNISILVGTITMGAVLKSYFGVRSYMLVIIAISIILLIILDCVYLFRKEMKQTGDMLKGKDKHGGV